MAKSFLIGFLFFPLIILFGCGDDEMIPIQNDVDCDNTDLDDIFLLEESKNFLPYPSDISKVIFTDAQGTEFEGEVKHYITSLRNSIHAMQPCPVDSTIQIDYNWESEIKYFVIQMDDLDIQLKILITPDLYTQDLSQTFVLEKFEFSLHVLDDFHDSHSPNSQILMVIDERNHPSPGEDSVEFYDEFQIHGEVFENVFATTSSSAEKFDLYYNAVDGIVGFKGQLDSGTIDLKFDRIE